LACGRAMASRPSPARRSLPQIEAQIDLKENTSFNYALSVIRQRQSRRLREVAIQTGVSRGYLEWNGAFC
jgi:hypothetical protein